MGYAPDDFEHVADRPGHDLRYAIDNSKLVTRARLGAEVHRTSATAWPTPSPGTPSNEAWWAPLKAEPSRRSTPPKGTESLGSVTRDDGQPRPRVTVLMATYNGMAEGGAWLDEQVDSVLAQVGVDVSLVVSDDASTDATRSHLEERAAADPRITVLPQRDGPPGVTGNFLHLFTTHPFDGSFVAFTDQDDVWHEDKLATQLALMAATGADVVSSNVTSFESLPGGGVGERRLIRKSQPMRDWDFLFEAAGSRVDIRVLLRRHTRLARAACSRRPRLQPDRRARLVRVRPRARDRTDLGDRRGANPGVPPARRQRAGRRIPGAGARDARMEKLRNGFYRDQFIRTGRAAQAVGTFDAPRRIELAAILRELEADGQWARLRFALRWSQIRRDRLEGLKLAAARVLRVW